MLPAVTKHYVLAHHSSPHECNGVRANDNSLAGMLVIMFTGLRLFNLCMKKIRTRTDSVTFVGIVLSC